MGVKEVFVIAGAVVLSIMTYILNIKYEDRCGIIDVIRVISRVIVELSKIN